MVFASLVSNGDGRLAIDGPLILIRPGYVTSRRNEKSINYLGVSRYEEISGEWTGKNDSTFRRDLDL